MTHVDRHEQHVRRAITIPELAKRLGWSRNHGYVLARNGKIPLIRGRDGQPIRPLRVPEDFADQLVDQAYEAYETNLPPSNADEAPDEQNEPARLPDKSEE
jgi:hypothetical protein